MTSGENCQKKVHEAFWNNLDLCQLCSESIYFLSCCHCDQKIEYFGPLLEGYHYTRAACLNQWELWARMLLIIHMPLSLLFLQIDEIKHYNIIMLRLANIHSDRGVVWKVNMAYDMLYNEVNMQK